MKHITHNKQSQISFSSSKLSQEFLQDPVLFISPLPDSYKKVFELLTTYFNYYIDVYPTQTFIAKKVGISREYCNKILRFFKGHGLLGSYFRFKKSCIYRLSTIFYSSQIRIIMSTIIKAFKWTTWAVMMIQLVRSDELSAIQFTLIKFNSYFRYLYLSQSGYPNERSPLPKRIVKPVIKREYKMSNPIIKEIRNIPHVSFSIHEQIKLSAYPPQAITFATQQLLKAKNIKNQFAWYNFVAKDYCTRHGIEPDNEWVSKLESSFRTNPKQFMVVDEVLKKPEEKRVESKSSQQFPHKKEYSDEEVERERLRYSRGEAEPSRKQTFKEALHVRDRYIQKQKDWIKTLPPVVPQPSVSAKASPDTEEEKAIKERAQSGPLPTKTWADLKSYEDIELELTKLEEYSKPEYLVDINKLLGKEFVANYLDRLTMNLKNHPLYVHGRNEDKVKGGYGFKLNHDELYQTKLE